MDMPTKPRRRDCASLPLPQEVALVLQGGGALGSFQAGVVQELARLDIEIDWVAGISIGAVNAAIVAGNPPERRVEQLTRFWELVSGGLPDLFLPEGNSVREAAHLTAAALVTMWGVPGFFRPHGVPAWAAAQKSQEALSYYDTSPLRETLDDLIDWELLNHGPVRFSVGAVDIESGNLIYFDNHDPAWKGKIDARHVMASGALPPGLPPVEIDGRHYWDGGLVSNTPLDHVLCHQTGDILIFQCDLFPAEGPLPAEMTQVWSRQKDIQYSSRTRQVTDQMLRQRREHKAIRALLDRLPEDLRDSAEARELEEISRESAVNIVHLIYKLRSWSTSARDFEFSRGTMRDNWTQGQEAVSAVIARGNRIIADNIVSGKTAAFDLALSGELKEKQA
ncbi:patatin-like phospholipase family protein [Sphingobium sp. CR28]|uniref:patatin-like phospholipase family protein n=1 Tax=Sphingobium sp. CR28 TaxID=3400272 RepID=UPI003FF02C2D